LFCSTAGAHFASTFFNSTIEVVEPSRLVDTELLAMWLMLAGIAAGIGECAAAPEAATPVCNRCVHVPSHKL